jgi:hypothetical protein
MAKEAHQPRAEPAAEASGEAASQPNRHRAGDVGQTMTPHDRTAIYLRALAALCLEVAAEPRLLLTFLAILRLVPQTLAELAALPFAAIPQKHTYIGCDSCYRLP